jgi:hypothetical protein
VQTVGTLSLGCVGGWVGGWGGWGGGKVQTGVATV